MTTRVRLKRYRSIQSLYFRFSCDFVAYFCLFSFIFLCVLSIFVLVAQAAVTHFPSAHTYTQRAHAHAHAHLSSSSSNPLLFPRFSFSSHANNCVLIIMSRIHLSSSLFFPFYQIVVIWIYSTIGRYPLRYNGHISGEFWCLRLMASVTVRWDDGNDPMTMTINDLDDDDRTDDNADDRVSMS